MNARYTVGWLIALSAAGCAAQVGGDGETETTGEATEALGADAVCKNKMPDGVTSICQPLYRYSYAHYACTNILFGLVMHECYVDNRDNLYTSYPQSERFTDDWSYVGTFGRCLRQHYWDTVPLQRLYNGKNDDHYFT